MPRRLNGQIRHAVLVRAPAERVCDAFATADGLDSWFTTGASVEAHAGGQMVWRWRNWGLDRITTEARGTVYEADRPRRFVFDWDSGDDRPTMVEISFEPCDEGTIVRLRERGYSDTAHGLGACLECATGWGEALTLVKFWLEHGLRY